MEYLFKILISAIIIASVSEIAKRNTFIAALTASLPLTSLLALIWLYHDTHDNQKIINLCYGIFWMVIPSLTFFLVLPFLIKQGMRFPWALILSSGCTALFYTLFAIISKKWGFKI